MMKTLIKNWSEYYNSIKDNSPESNLKPSSIFKSSEAPKEEMVNNLTSDNGDHIICFINHANKVQVIHSLSNLGGLNKFPTDFIVGISVFKNEKGSAVSIDSEELLTPLKIEVPTSFNRIKSTKV